MNAVTEPNQPTSPNANPGASSGRHKLPDKPSRVLVADDEHLVATGLAATLDSLGYDVVGPAADGEQAIRLCEQDAPDMALLDIRMPKVDGLTAAREIYHRFRVPVVIFSAFSDPQYVESSQEVGVFGYILKPVSQDQLRVMLSVAWGRYRDAMSQSSEIQTLQKRLEDRKIIEQAKWVLVEKRSIAEPEAMRMLQRHARNNRRPLVEVAKAVIENEALFTDE